MVGNIITFLAVPWFVLQTTGSAARTGLTGGVVVLGMVLGDFSVARSLIALASGGQASSPTSQHLKTFPLQGWSKQVAILTPESLNEGC
jgi:hypothetical protein